MLHMIVSTGSMSAGELKNEFIVSTIETFLRLYLNISH